jgi:cytochrome b6-f complex iron-sulfur subunit
MSSKPATPENKTDEHGRRGFFAVIGGLTVAWVGGTLYPVYRYLSPRPAPDPFAKGHVKVDGVQLGDVARPGAAKAGGYAGRGLVVMRASDGSLRAFDTKCSHAGCNVRFEGSRFVCPCHGGVYDLDGKNVSGPPPRPLLELAVAESEGALVVSRKVGGKG